VSRRRIDLGPAAYIAYYVGAALWLAFVASLLIAAVAVACIAALDGLGVTDLLNVVVR
jgi:hypothetical protein